MRPPGTGNLGNRLALSFPARTSLPKHGPGAPSRARSPARQQSCPSGMRKKPGYLRHQGGSPLPHLWGCETRNRTFCSRPDPVTRDGWAGSQAMDGEFLAGETRAPQRRIQNVLADWLLPRGARTFEPSARKIPHFLRGHSPASPFAARSASAIELKPCRI